MKKVGILVNSIGYGGNERSAVNIANAIRKKYDVRIIIQEEHGNNYGYTGKVINLNTPCARSTIGKAFNSVRRIVRLKRVISKEEFDTLFIILPVSNPINYISFKCRKIVSCRDCGDLIRRTDKYIKMTDRSDLIVCNSEYQADYLKKQAPQLEHRIRVIYNIIDIDGITMLKQSPVEEYVDRFMCGNRCVISAGRFVDPKGLNNLLKSYSLVARTREDIKLIMIGDGELRCNVENLIEELHIKDKVLLLGFKDNPFKYIAKSDVFVLTSFYEGFPNTLVEAMACMTPVIATDCPSGPREILCGEVDKSDKLYEVTRCGILCKCFDKQKSTWEASDIHSEHSAFAEAILRVLDNPDLSNEMVENASQRVKEFSASKITLKWDELL